MMTAADYPHVAMLSLWRNDAGRNLEARARHLLSKTYPALRWVWIVGDSTDDTYNRLLDIVNALRPGRQVDLLMADTGIVGEDEATRRRRLGVTANFFFRLLKSTDAYLLIHESDLVSPLDIAERFLAHAAAGRCPIAGWPILPLDVEGHALFYDIWAYRKDGALFTNCPPFHACYRHDEPFEVDSVGSCWMFAAEDARRGARFGDHAVLDLCAALRAHGRQFWVDPQLTIIQPRELWEPHSTAD